MSRRRSRRSTKRIIGYAAVGVVSVALIVLIILGLVRTPGGESPQVKDPDVVVDGVGYEKRRELQHLLLIGVPDDESLGAQYLTLITMNRSAEEYVITNIDYRINAWIKPLNVYDSRVNEYGLIQASIGKAQIYGDGAQTSSWNTARAVERMLDISIYSVMCLRTSGSEAPEFQSAPAMALSKLLAEINNVCATTGKPFAAAAKDVCVWSEFAGSAGLQDLVDRLNRYTCTSARPYTLVGAPVSEGVYEISQQELDRLKVELFLKKIDTETSTGGES